MSNHAEAAAGAPTPGRGGSGAARGTAAPAPRVKGPRPPMTGSRSRLREARNEDLRKWRLSVPMDKFKEVRKRFDTAGIELEILCYNMD